MTTPQESAAGAGRPRLERLVQRARLALLWERVWPPLATVLAVVLLFLTASWFGLWDELPRAWRIVGVALFAAALAAAAWPLARLAMPARASALARIDRSTGTAHRPATTLADHLATGGEDSFTRALWQAHQARTEAAATGLRVGLPSPRLALRDPRALRFLLCLVAVVAFIAAGDDRLGRIGAAFSWSTPAAAPIPPRLDAWVTPPAYTGRPPVFLTGSAAPADRAAALAVPSGSVVVVRSSGGTVEVQAGGGAKSQPVEQPVSAGAREDRFVLESDATLAVSGRGLESRDWRFSVLPDAPPTIALKADPQNNGKGALALAYEVKDDYGVVSAEAIFDRRNEVLERGPPPRPLYPAPKGALALPQARTQSGEANSAIDLQEHPWAGATVTLTLLARDEIGQEGRSETRTVTLPARPFSDPLARALVEQRRKLALDATARDRVQRALDALAKYPERFTPKLAHYLGLRTAYWRLANAETDDHLREVADYLWEMALAIEEGDLTGAERDLRAAEQALREALERGASDEEIKRLTDQLRQAMNEFLKELARRMPEASPQEQAQMPPDARMLRPQDLQNMLDRMEQMARQGNREAAQQMLSELKQMLDNLRNARRMQRNPQAEALNKSLDELGDMIREQNQLRDRTYRDGGLDRGERSRQQQQRGRQQGRQPQNRPGQNGEGQQPGDMQGLAEMQRQLRERLEQLRKQLEQQGMGQGGQQGEGPLGEAEGAMEGAEGSLGQGNAPGAVDQQGRALEALRRGAQQLAESMMGQGEGPDGEPGDGAPNARRGDNGEENYDPLGRPTRSRTYDTGNSVKVPGEIDAQRARRVLEDIRRRLGEPNRPREELEYLERLLQ